MSKVRKQTKSNPQDIVAKVIIVGDSGVGKTNLLTQYCEGIFKDSYVATIGVDFKIKIIQIDGKKIKLQLWDTAGQQRFKNIAQTYFKGASGIILVYAINNYESFKNISTWIKQIENNNQNSSMILIGSKSDMNEERQVDSQEGQALADKHNMIFREVSAKTGRNVNQAFQSLTIKVKQRNQNTKVNSDNRDTVSIGGKMDQTKKKCIC